MTPRAVTPRGEPSLVRTAYVRWQAVLEAFRGHRAAQPRPAAPLPSREPAPRSSEPTRERERERESSDS